MNTYPDQNACAAIAKEILNAGEAKLGTDESVFNKYFGSLSPYELCCVAQHYHKLTGHTILEAIKKEFVGDSKKAFNLSFPLDSSCFYLSLPLKKSPSIPGPTWDPEKGSCWQTVMGTEGVISLIIRASAFASSGQSP